MTHAGAVEIEALKADIISGKLKVESSPGNGTLIRGEIPLG